MNQTIHPFLEAIESIIGSLPLMVGHDNFPLAQKLKDIIHSSNLDDEVYFRLQDYCGRRAKPVWATGESIIHAANLIVERAFENANLEMDENGVILYLRG
jgi:hypothetical protein